MLHAFVVNAIALIAFLALLGGAATLILTGTANREKGKRFFGGDMPERREKKMVIDPKVAVCEPGICQCNCALAYHRGGGSCGVPGCPCQQFIPSTLGVDDLEAVANANIVRINIDTVNQRLELEKKQLALEQAEADRIRRQELAARKSIDSTSTWSKT